MPGRTPIEESVRPESGDQGLPGCPAAGNAVHFQLSRIPLRRD